MKGSASEMTRARDMASLPGASSPEALAEMSDAAIGERSSETRRLEGSGTAYSRFSAGPQRANGERIGVWDVSSAGNASSEDTMADQMTSKNDASRATGDDSHAREKVLELLKDASIG